MLTRRRVMKWSLFAIAAILVCSAALLVYVHLKLKSGDVARQSMQDLQGYLSPLGVKLEKLQSAKIDVLRSVRLKDIQFDWKDENLGNISVTADYIDLQYSLGSLIASELVIDKIQCNDVTIKAALTAPSANDGDAKDSPDTDNVEPLDMATLEDLLAAPPLPVDIKSIDINNINLDIDLDLQQGRQHVTYRGVLQHLGANMLLQPGILRGSLDIKINTGDDTRQADTQDSYLRFTQYLEQTSKTPDSGSDTIPKSLSIEALPIIDTSLQWDLSDQNGWRMNPSELHQGIKLVRIKLVEDITGQPKTVGTIDAISVGLDGDVRSQAAHVTQAGLKAAFPVAIDARITTSVSAVQIQQLRLDGLTLTTQAEQNLLAKVLGQIDPWADPAPELSIEARQALNIATLEASMPEQYTALKNAQLNISAKGNTSSNNNRAAFSFDAQLDNPVDQVEFQQRDPNTQKTTLVASLRPSTRISTQGSLTSLRNIPAALILELKPEISMRDIEVKMYNAGKEQQYKIREQRSSVAVNYRDTKFDAQGDIRLNHVNIPQAEKSFSLTNLLRAAGAFDNSSNNIRDTNISLQTQLDQLSLLDLQILANDNQGKFEFKPSLNANIPKGLRHYFTSAGDLIDAVGRLQLEARISTALNHGQTSIFVADTGNLAQLPLTANISATLKQLSQPKDKHGLHLSKPLSINVQLDKQDKYKLDFAAHAPAIKHSPLRKPLDAELYLQSAFNWPLESAETLADVIVDQNPLLKLQLALQNQTGKFTLDSRCTAQAGDELLAKLPVGEKPVSLGKLQSDLHLDVAITHARESILSMNEQDLGSLGLLADLTTRVRQSQPGRHNLLQLREPVTFDKHIDYQQQKLLVTGKLRAKDMTVAMNNADQQNLSLKNISLDYNLKTDLGKTIDSLLRTTTKPDALVLPKQVSLSVSVPKAGLLYPDDKTDFGALATPIDVHAAVKQTGARYRLDQLSVDIGNKLIHATGQGSMSKDATSLQTEGSITAALRKNLLPDITGGGSVQIPWRLTMTNGKQATLDSRVIFKDLTLNSKQFELSEVNGEIVANQEIVFRDGGVKFGYLLQPDPFQRVDFNRVQPYLNNPSLQLQRFRYKDVQVGPLLTQISLKQNLLRLPQFDLSALNGHVTGQFYLDTHPGAWKVGLLSRISQVDLRQVLSPENSENLQEYAPISARTALEFELNRRLLQGRVDINAIDKYQLLQLLEIIDPEYKDSQLARVRTGLHLAHPKWVKTDMHQGLLDLEVAISVMPKPINVSGLPLTNLIQHFAGDTLDEINKLPLR